MSTSKTVKLGFYVLGVGVLGLVGGRVFRHASAPPARTELPSTTRHSSAVAAAVAASASAPGKTPETTEASAGPAPGHRGLPATWPTVPTGTYQHSSPIYAEIEATAEEERLLDQLDDQGADKYLNIIAEHEAHHIDDATFKKLRHEHVLEMDQEILRILGPERGQKYIELSLKRGGELANNIPGQEGSN